VIPAGKEADVDDRGRVAVSAVVGAVSGAILGYIYLTEGGRRFREQIEPGLDDFLHEVRRMRGTVDKARAAASEGWRSLNEVIGESQGGGWDAPPDRASH
jgi:hypothetical protein